MDDDSALPPTAITVTCPSTVSSGPADTPNKRMVSPYIGFVPLVGVFLVVATIVICLYRKRKNGSDISLPSDIPAARSERRLADFMRAQLAHVSANDEVTVQEQRGNSRPTLAIGGNFFSTKKGEHLLSAGSFMSFVS